MMFFLAIPLENKPFVWWNSIANSIEQLVEIGEYENPLVVAHDQVPEFIFGVCPLKIVDGELVSRSESEMEVFESEFSVAEIAIAQRRQSADLDSANFIFDANTFPMNQTACFYYQSIANQPDFVNCDILTTTGEIYTLDVNDLDGFIAAFWKQIKSLTQPK